MADAAGDPVVRLKHNSLKRIAMKRSVIKRPSYISLDVDGELT